MNLDYFGVTIDEIPDLNDDSIPESPEEFLSHIRKNINSFVNTNLGEFVPLPEDVALWDSDNPFLSIVEIAIPLNHGSVITSQVESCCWIFTTLNAPYGGDNIHPVSGHRQFGFSVNSDGSFTYYTKGADRISKWWYLLGEPLSFEIPDLLWGSFQNKIKEFVNGARQVGMQAIHFKGKEDLSNKLNALGVKFDD